MYRGLLQPSTGLAIALYLYLIGRVAESGGFLRAIFELLFSGFVVLPYVFLCCLVLLVAGMFCTLRPWAGLVLVALNVAVLATSWVISPPKDFTGLGVWLPSFLSAVIAAYLAYRGFWGGQDSGARCSAGGYRDAAVGLAPWVQNEGLLCPCLKLSNKIGHLRTWNVR